MPKQKINRPNLSQYDIQTRDDDYAKHNRCGGLIAHAPLERTLRCLTCERKVGRRGSDMLRKHASSMMEQIEGVGMMGLYFYPLSPAEQETTDDACSRVIKELKADLASSKWNVETTLFRQESGPYGPGSVPEDAPSVPDGPPTMEGFSEGVETGRLASYGSKASATRAKRNKRRQQKAKASATEAARARAEQMLASGQDRSGSSLNQTLPEHFERLARARPIARPKDESLLAKVQRLELDDRGGYMNQAFTETALDGAAQEARVALAREEIEESQLSGDAAPDWAVRAVKQHKEARRERAGRKLIDALAIEDAAARAGVRRSEEPLPVHRPKRYGSEIEFAKAEIAKCQGAHREPSDWAIRAVNQHREGQKRLNKAIAIEDTEVRVIARPKSFVDALEHDDSAKRRAASQATCQGRVETPEEKKTRFEHMASMCVIARPKEKLYSGDAQRQVGTQSLEKKRFYEEN